MIVEALLLTKNFNSDDLKFWIDWHLNKCKFDRLHIIDNESYIDIPEIIKNDVRITYENVKGYARQYVLYDTYINEKSNADWIIPIDDDEYLDFENNFKSVQDLLKFYSTIHKDLHLFAIRWKHLFPKDFKEKRNGRNIFEYCTEENYKIANLFSLGDFGVKTFVKRDGIIHYQETWENPSGGHVPLHSKQPFGALLSDGEKIVKNYSTNLYHTTELVRLLHCRYKGPDDWDFKYNNLNYVSDKINKTRYRDTKFNEFIKNDYYK